MRRIITVEIDSIVTGYIPLSLRISQLRTWSVEREPISSLAAVSWKVESS
jgi:hypothetical protein